MWQRPSLFQSETKTNPLHWFFILCIAASCVGWMLTDTSPEVDYRHSTKYQPAAIKALHLDEQYRVQMQRVSKVMAKFCDRGSHIVFAHNVEMQGTALNDHLFHECGGHTWLNARITESSPEQVLCQEEFANSYKTRTKAKNVRMRAVDVDTWSEQEVSGSKEHACRWVHAIDILENKWL